VSGVVQGGVCVLVATYSVRISIVNSVIKTANSHIEPLVL